MKWITRKKVKLDRVPCPWLMRRFIDPEAGLSDCEILEREHHDDLLAAADRGREKRDAFRRTS